MHGVSSLSPIVPAGFSLRPVGWPQPVCGTDKVFILELVMKIRSVSIGVKNYIRSA